MKSKHKSIIILLLGCILITCLSGCKKDRKNEEGDVSDVAIANRQSYVYTGQDFDEAIETVKQCFKEEFKGCSMSYLKYVGDEENFSDNYQYYLDPGTYDEIIAFTSTFLIAKEATSTMDKDSVQTDYSFILGRKTGGSWVVITYGRG